MIEKYRKKPQYLFRNVTSQIVMGKRQEKDAVFVFYLVVTENCVQ